MNKKKTEFHRIIKYVTGNPIVTTLYSYYS